MKYLFALVAYGALTLSPVHAADIRVDSRQVEKAAAAASAPKGTPARSAAAESDCAMLRRRYLDSASCYAPFFNVNGSIKPGAFETCGPAVPFPARECSSQPLR
jgi:hypothetical protein